MIEGFTIGQQLAVSVEANSSQARTWGRRSSYAVRRWVGQDAGCKAGNVWLENFDKNKPGNADELPVPLIVMIKFRGSVSDVQAALEAAKAKAEQLAGVVNEYEIARPTEDTEKMLKISAFDKGTPHKINKEEIEEI